MAKNHPLMKDVKNWILDSFSFMDGVGYDILFDDDIYGMENTKAISADIDGLTDFDFEKGKKNLLKSIPNKIKAEFPYLRIVARKDGDYFIMFIILLDNNDYLEDKNIQYINLNESKESTKKSLKEEKEVWIIKSKDDLQYVGKKIFDVCEDIENARKFKSKFEAEEFLKKHDKALDYRYWKVINIVSESKESARKSIKESKEINLIDNVANKLRKITDAYVDTYRGADWISLGKDEYTIKIIYMRNELSIELYKDGDFKDGELEYASSLSDDDFSVNYIIDFIKNFIKNRNYLKNKISIKESKEFTRKSLREMFGDEGIVDDFVDFLIYDCGYDKKNCRKIFL